MGKSSRNKKLEKRKKRTALKKKAAIKTKVKRAATEKRLKEYPTFHYKDYDQNIVSEEFVKEVKSILNTLRFDNRSYFNPKVQDFFKLMKEHGFETIISKVLGSISDKKERNVADLNFRFFVGNIVYKKLNQKGILENYIPFNDVNIVPEGYDFVVIFDGMLWEKTKWGRVYYSPQKPKILIDGKEYIVAFSNHAIQRICDRCVKYWKKYAGAGDAFAFLNKYSKFELIKTIQNNEIQYFLTLYDSCKKGYTNYRYVRELLREHDPNKKYYYKVGYCPIAISNNFASIKTLLIPGMKGTPEYIKMKESNLEFSDQKNFGKLAGSILKNEISVDSSDWDALKWYHTNGIPQVVELAYDPFGYT